MAMAWLWTGMVAVSLVFGILTGSVGELGNAALEGASAAVELCVAMAGIMCLWTGVMEVMEQSRVPIKQYLQKFPKWGRFGVTSVTPFLLLPVHPEGCTPARRT